MSGLMRQWGWGGWQDGWPGPRVRVTPDQGGAGLERLSLGEAAGPCRGHVVTSQRLQAKAGKEEALGQAPQTVYQGLTDAWPWTDLCSWKGDRSLRSLLGIPSEQEFWGRPGATSGQQAQPGGPTLGQSWAAPCWELRGQ